MMIFVNTLFVVRSAVQGMVFPFLPMLSGILEMFLRIIVISTLMNRLGFRATAYAEISAWIGAFLVNLLAFHISLSPLLPREKNRTHVRLFRHGNGGDLHGTL
ncbi:MAG: hypothetical protein J6Z46_04280 [Lachnospiraceae bacterium]|nr:hypothetical protein [Lachnospiraceae bacterium]